MNRSFKNIFSCALIVAAALSACQKDKNTPTPGTPDPTPDSTITPDPVETTGFSYAENGASVYTSADDAWVNGDYNTIIAQNDNNTVCEINLTALTEGDYSLGSGNALTYIKSGAYYAADDGTVTITKNAGGKLSGTFTSTGTGISGVTSVSGKFTDIPVK